MKWQLLFCAEDLQNLIFSYTCAMLNDDILCIHANDHKE